MPLASKTFDHALQAVLREPLRQHGFVFDGSRTFRRTASADGEVVQIIQFQLGQHSHEGRFAVNLAVYVPREVPMNPARLHPSKALEFHCAPQRRERLGRLVPVRFGFLRHLPYLGSFFGPQDIWWRHHVELPPTLARMHKVMALLELRGLPWLDAHTPREHAAVPTLSATSR
jgi:hypothetical protein